MTKKKYTTDFVTSIAENKTLQPTDLKILSKKKDIEDPIDSQAISEQSTPDSQPNEQKGKKISADSILSKLSKKESGPLKPVPIPETVHRKISQLSNVTDYGISDITTSALIYLFDNHKEEIRKMIQKQTLNEWK